VQERNALIFGVTRISIKHCVGWVEGSLRAKNQRDPSSRFDTIPACDRQTDRQTQSRNESLPVSPNQPCQMTTAAGGAVTMTTVTIVD